LLASIIAAPFTNTRPPVRSGTGSSYRDNTAAIGLGKPPSAGTTAPLEEKGGGAADAPVSARAL